MRAAALRSGGCEAPNTFRNGNGPAGTLSWRGLPTSVGWVVVVGIRGCVLRPGGLGIPEVLTTWPGGWPLPTALPRQVEKRAIAVRDRQAVPPPESVPAVAATSPGSEHARALRVPGRRRRRRSAASDTQFATYPTCTAAAGDRTAAGPELQHPGPRRGQDKVEDVLLVGGAHPRDHSAPAVASRREVRHFSCPVRLCRALRT